MILPDQADARSSAKFNLGRLVATPGALEALTQTDIQTALARHHAGDWGDLCEEDRKENELSLKQGFRLLSVYYGGVAQMRFYIITEADRSLTTVLLPSEY